MQDAYTKRCSRHTRGGPMPSSREPPSSRSPLDAKRSHGCGVARGASESGRNLHRTTRHERTEATTLTRDVRASCVRRHPQMNAKPSTERMPEGREARTSIGSKENTPHWSLVRLLWRFASGRAAFLVVVAGPELVPTTLRRPDDAERALFCPPLPPCDTQRCDMAPGERGN